MTDSFKILMGIWILTDKLFNANVLLLDLVEEKVEGWVGRKLPTEAYGILGPTLLTLGSVSLTPTPTAVPFLLF